MMIIIKIIAIVVTVLSGLLQIGLEDRWKDKRTRSHKKIKYLLISLMILGSLSAMSLVVYDNIESEKKERIAQEDRAHIQNKLDEINYQMKPLIDIAKSKYPGLSIDEALKKLSQDLNKMGEDLEKTKSITHSFSSEVTFYIEANWVDGKTPSAPGIISMGPDPELTLDVVKTSGQPQKLELRLDGMASIKKEGKIAIMSYRAKALPKSWILGQDYREIKGYGPIRAHLFNINRTVTADAKVIIKRMIIEIFINGRSTAVFDQNVNENMTLPEGPGTAVLEIKLPEIIRSKGI